MRSYKQTKGEQEPKAQIWCSTTSHCQNDHNFREKKKLKSNIQKRTTISDSLAGLKKNDKKPEKLFVTLAFLTILIQINFSPRITNQVDSIEIQL